MKTVAVVGAGVSGLSCAHFLRQAGAPLRLRVFEAGSGPGGTMRTLVRDGYRVERGPNGFLTNRPDALALARALGLESRLQSADEAARRRFLFSGGRLRPLPESPAAFLASGLLSWRGKLSVLAEPFAPGAPAEKDESVAEFAVRRLGREAMEKLIEPMAAGVFAGNPDELSLSRCFPRIRELEDRYGGLVRAMLGLAWERRKARLSAAPGGVLTSFRGGAQELVDELARRSEGELVLDARVESLARAAGAWRVRVGGSLHDADAVVLAVPAYEASRLTRGLDAALADELRAIPYAPIAVAALGYDAAAVGPLRGFGFLVPRLEGRRILGALWDSSVFPGRAPEGKALIRVMIGGARRPRLAALPPDQLLALAREELSAAMGVSADPELEEVFVYEQGIPQYVVGHGRRLEALSGRLASWPGLFLDGNAYRGISLNDCVRESAAAARAVLAYLAKGGA